MNTIWIVMAVVGAVMLAVTLFADTFEIDLPGTDAGLPAEAIAGFLTATGLIGYLLQSTGVASIVTVPAALGAGTGMGVITVSLVRFLIRTPTDATPNRADFIGAIAKVVTPITGSGVGEVLLSRHGQPWKVAAQLADGDGHLDIGAQVVIVDSVSATRVVVVPSDL